MSEGKTYRALREAICEIFRDDEFIDAVTEKIRDSILVELSSSLAEKIDEIAEKIGSPNEFKRR